MLRITLGAFVTSQPSHALFLEWSLLVNHSAGGNSGLKSPPFAYSLSVCGLGESRLLRWFCKLFQPVVLRNLLCQCHDTLPQTCCEDQTLIEACSLNKTGCPLTPDGHPIDLKHLTLISFSN